jgi:hypothetical protein
MSSERVITLQLNGTHGPNLGPGVNTLAIFVNEEVSFELDNPPPPDIAPQFLPDIQGDGIVFDWERRKLIASKPGMAQFRCSWSGQGISYMGIVWLVVLPATASPSEGARAVRHLLVRGPDMDFYLFSPGQTQWPKAPFTPGNPSEFLKSFEDWGVGGASILLENPNGLIGALFKVAFTAVDGTPHSFYILNLPALMLAIQAAKNHRGYEFRSLLLGGPDQRGYLIPWTGDGYTMAWPKDPASMASNPFIPRTNGASVERFLYARLHDDVLGNVMMYDLAEMLHLLNREDAPRVVASLYSRSDRGAYSYRFFQIGDSGIQALDPGLQQDELRDYQGGRLRSGVLCSRVSTATRDTYLYNINSYADAAEGWAPSHGIRNELLIRTPGAEPSSNNYYYFFDSGQDNDGGDSAAQGELDMEKHWLDPSRIPPSIHHAAAYGVATGIILQDQLQRPLTAASEVAPPSEFISCYLLNLSVLLPR